MFKDITQYIPTNKSTDPANLKSFWVNIKDAPEGYMQDGINPDPIYTVTFNVSI